MNRNIARNVTFTVAGMVTAIGAVAGTVAIATPDQPQGPTPEQPIVSTEHDPAPTRTVVQRVTQPRATTTVTQKPQAPKPQVITKVVTRRPFGTNPGDCPEEDSCWADYDGKTNRWIIKKGEQPNRRQQGTDLLPKEIRERANRGEFDPKPKPATKSKVTNATKPATTRQAEPVTEDDPNGPRPGEELRLPVAPEHTEPPAPDVK